MRTFPDHDAALQFLRSIPWGNAAGTCKDGELAENLATVGVSVVSFGSITKDARSGNEGSNFYCAPDGTSINSLGLPGPSLASVLPQLPEIRARVEARGARLSFSFSAGNHFDPLEYYEAAEQIVSCRGASIFEGNYACPNVVVSGKPKPIVGYDPHAFSEGCRAVAEATRGSDVEVAVKLPPITEPALLGELVDICLYWRVRYIVAANTFGNCVVLGPDGKPAIPMIRGGLAGTPARFWVQGMTSMIAPKLKGTATKLIAVGGVSCGEVAWQHLNGGADGFGFNTALYARGNDPKVVQEIIMGTSAEAGLVDLLVERGLPNWSDVAAT